MLFVPCAVCEGKCHLIDNINGIKEICFSCLGEGKHEVSNDEYLEFFRDSFR